MYKMWFNKGEGIWLSMHSGQNDFLLMKPIGAQRFVFIKAWVGSCGGGGGGFWSVAEQYWWREVLLLASGRAPAKFPQAWQWLQK